MTHPVLLRPECVTAAGDIVTGVLLSQIVYWTPKMRLRRGGVLWIAKTREEWMTETGLTLEQYKRAVSVLRVKRLVEVKVMRFRGLAMSHLRLLQPIAGVKPTNRMGGNPPTGWSKTHHPSTESTAEITGSSLPGLAYTKPERGGVLNNGKKPTGWKGNQEIEEKEEIKEQASMKASTILAQMQASSTGSLEAFWKARYKLTHGGDKYQPPLTGKQRGQLAQLQKYLGDQTRPVIDYALNHWWKFASKAGGAGGVSFPAHPHIGFLLKYHAVAVNLLTAPPVSLPPVEPPLQPIAHEEEAPHTLTSQELTEMLEGLKSP